MDVINLVQSFREYYGSKGYTEIVSQSLISKHDSSIRFTNSTSSVMKPFFINNRKMSEKLMLIQPAMGCQGIDYWINKKTIDRFSSYFLSFGIMGPCDELQNIIKSSIDFFLEELRINKENFVIQYNNKDNEFVDALKGINVISANNAYADDYYIHHFGVEGLIGKTLCYTIKDGDNYYYIGSVIILEQDGNPVAVEHSFDSTLLLSGIKDSHPVIELPGIFKWNKYYEDSIPFQTRIAYFDLLFVATILIMEGLKPGARGRRKKLRVILIEISSILNNYNIRPNNFTKIISDIYDEEMKVRTILKRFRPLQISKDEIEKTVLNQIQKC